MNEVFLLLGSNLGNREQMLNSAIQYISSLAGEVKIQSSLYETEPWGTDDPLPFLNKIIVIQTDIQPLILITLLLEIEKLLGRKRDNDKNRPRTIDIDILFFNDMIINEPMLIVPHPRIQLRRFVLIPLCEIAPEKIHPVLQKNITTLFDECSDKSWVKKA